MVPIKNNIIVYIVNRQYLINIGIKTLIHHLGLEPDYVTTNNLSAIDFGKSTINDYLILHHKLLLHPQTDHLQSIVDCFKGEILVIGNHKMKSSFHKHLLLPNDSETDTLEKLQHFFASHSNDENEENNSVLSAREIEILQEVARGFSNKEIADRLFISINTVITHRKNITEKLGIKTISGLTVYALMNKLIHPEDVK